MRTTQRQQGGRVAMRLKRSNAGPCACALASLLAGAALALAAAPALALPEGRAYEMVSPVYKGGYGAKSVEAVSLDGESVGFYSPGAFAGAPSGPVVGMDYIAHRTATGWATTSVVPPAGMLPYGNGYDASPTLGTVMALGKPGSNQEGAFQTATEGEVLLHDTGLPDSNANWELAGMVLRAFPAQPLGFHYVMASPDFCHIIVEPALGIMLLPNEAGVTKEQTYELDRGCGGEPVALRNVGLNNKQKPISPTCKIEIGQQSSTAAESQFNAVADGGREIFFTGGCLGPSGRHQLFARLDGARTLEVSKPLADKCSEVPCEPEAAERADANFIGASEDGSRVFFTTTQEEETPGVKDATENLYMAGIGCPAGEPECEVAGRRVTSLTQVSHNPAGQPAEVQGVVRIAPDGSRVYFVARGVLSDGANEEGNTPVRGADNLYVYEPDPEHAGQDRTVFIAELCSGRELSGSVEDLRCPSEKGVDGSLWAVQSAGVDGRFLVFASFGQLVAGDTDTAADVYRYNTVTGRLARVSIGERGADANGNNDRFDASIRPGHWGGEKVLLQYEMDNRAVNEDGSRIVFTSAEPLSADAKNHLANAYEWHQAPGESEGRVSLISSGSDTEPVEDVVISPQGGDIFFVTSQGLAPQDTDGQADIYDARLGRGFPPAGAERRHCEGDACQGPLTDPAPLLVPGSASQAPGGNYSASTPTTRATPKRALSKCAKRKRRNGGRCVKAKAHRHRARTGRAGNGRKGG